MLTKCSILKMAPVSLEKEIQYLLSVINTAKIKVEVRSHSYIAFSKINQFYRLIGF
jgi:hypothetical protein